MLLGLCAVGCAPSEEEIQSEFDAFVAERNRCEDASDCALATPGCPLSCFVYVHRAKVEEVEAKAKALIEDYERLGATCEYDCIEPPGTVCEQQRCASKN